MSEQQVEQVWVGFRAGESLSRIGRREGVPLQHVRRYLNQQPSAEGPEAGGVAHVEGCGGGEPGVGRRSRSATDCAWTTPTTPGCLCRTIYLAIYRPHRRAVNTKLHRQLRTGRLMRHPKLAAVPSGRGRLKGMVPIADRPAEVADRLVAGHREGDLAMGTRPSAVATLVERTTRYLRVVALPGGIKAAPVRAALAADLLEVDPGLRRSLTWDRGREMAEHAELTTDTGCPVFFCDPRSPWQRGTNENTNRLLRQYLSKNHDLRMQDQAALDRIAARLNSRPRRVLGWRTPAEACSAL